MRVARIDGDIICYSVGFAAEDDPVEYALHSAKKMIEKIVDRTNADEYRVYLSGPDNFRDDVAVMQPYKGNRKNARKPKHHAAIQKYLIGQHKAVVSANEEADDVLGTVCTTFRPSIDDILCSIDKDLDMIVGEHYNWRKDELYTINREGADDFFIEQLLTGDSTDNIPGLYRFTGQRATKKLKEKAKAPHTFNEKFAAVVEIYLEAFHKAEPEIEQSMRNKAVAAFIKEIGTLLWIRRKYHKTFSDYMSKEGHKVYASEES